MNDERDEPSGLAALPWSSRAFYVVILSSLMGVMGVSLISPVLPSLRSVFGVSDAQVGLVITAYTLPGIVLTPFVGLLADRIGRRRVLVPLLFIFGVSGAGVAFVDEFTHVLLLRFLQGVGASALISLSVTLIGDFYEGTQRDAVMGFNGSSMSTGAALYPLLGGLLAAVRWNAPFLFFGVGILVGLVALLVLEEPTLQESTDVRTYFGRLREAALEPRALVLFAAVFSAFFLFYGGVLTAVPLLLSDVYGLTAAEIGPVLAMVALASAVVSSQYGRLANWRTGPELVALGFVAYGASLVGIWLATSPTLIGAALLSFGVGFGVVMPSIDTTLVTLVSGELRAGVMGLRTSVLRLGQTLGPFAFTFVAETAFATTAGGYRVLLVAGGTVVALSGAGAYVVARR
jgi:MFS family permease